ncbi:hypothetical protein ABIB26_003805 [Arthrobacter sp. UYEF20]
MFELVSIDHGRPPGPPAVGRGHRPRVRSALGRVGSFHLPEECQHDQCQLAHRPVRLGGIDGKGICQGPDADAAFPEVMDQVRGVFDGPSQPVQGMDDENVAGPGMAECFLEPWAVRGGAGLLIDMNVCGINAGGRQGVQLPGQILFRC